MALVTLAEAKLDQLIDGSAFDSRLQLHLDAAESWALDYCRLQAAPADPRPVAAFKVAILLRLRDLSRGQGEGPDTAAARGLINPYRLLSV